MRLNLLTCLFGFFLLAPCTGNTTTTIEIPLNLEPTPTGKDSFIPYYEIKRPKVALALSGGGARGIAQIGVLKVIEKYGIPIDAIAGTSMGAIIGGLYAIGYSANQIEDLFREVDWEEIIQDSPPRKQLFLGQKTDTEKHIIQLRLNGFSLDLPSAYTSGQKLSSLITNLVIHAPNPFSEDFDHIGIPFRSVTTDLISGNKVILSRGSLVDALRASMAIPLLFTPVKIDTVLLVDGGLLQNLPVDEARDLGGDIVIAVDTSSKLRSIESLKAPWEIADQVTTIMQQGSVLSQLHKADIAIRPQLENISNTDFHLIDQIIQSGQDAAEEISSQFERLIKTWNQKENTTHYKVSTISISGLHHLDGDELLSGLDLSASSDIPHSQIVWAGQSLIQTGYISHVLALLDTQTNHLIFQAKENPYCKNIRFRGNTVFSHTLLDSSLLTKTNSVLNLHTGRQDINKILNKYYQKGYVLAQIDTVIIADQTLNIRINEGYIQNIYFQGNEKTKAFIIKRELVVEKNKPLRDTLLNQSIDNIFSTGYFNGVRCSFRRAPFGYNLIFLVAEKAYTLLRAGFRYDLERRSKGFLQIAEQNLLGLGLEGALTGTLGKRDAKADIQIRTDRVVNSYMTAKMNISTGKSHHYFYKKHKETGRYQTSVTEASFSIGQQMRRLGTVCLQLASQSVHLKPLLGENTPDEQFILRHLTVRSEVDTRNTIPFATSGKYHLLEYETALRILASDISYFRLFSSLESYYTLIHNIIFRPRIIWGTSDLTTPFFKQFHMGGLDSFMGLSEQDMVGRRFFTVNTEIRFKLPFRFWFDSYLSVHYDIGGIWGRYSKIEWKDFKQGAGAVFSLDTPVGPLHFGWGHMSDGIQQFYLSAGCIF